MSDTRRIHRRKEIEALRSIAIEPDEVISLLFRLDPFSHDLDSERMRKHDDRLDDRCVLL